MHQYELVDDEPEGEDELDLALREILERGESEQAVYELVQALLQRGRVHDALWCLHEASRATTAPAVVGRYRQRIATVVAQYYREGFPLWLHFLLPGVGIFVAYIMARARLSGLDPSVLAIYQEEARRERPLAWVVGTWILSFVPALAATLAIMSDSSLRPESWGWAIYAVLVLAALTSSLLLVKWALRERRRRTGHS